MNWRGNRVDVCRAIGEVRELLIAGEGREYKKVQLQNTLAANVIEGSGIKVLGVLRGKNEARVSGCTSTCGRRLDTAAAATGGAMLG